MSGFTLIEMLFAVALMAIFVQSILYYMELLPEKASAARTIGAVDELTSSLYSFRVDDANKVGGVGTWPADITALIPYLPNNDPTTGNGESFVLAPVTTISGPMYSITIPARSEYEANIIADNYRASATVDFDAVAGRHNVVRIVQRPGGETSNEQLLHVDGIRDVEGNLTFNNGATFKESGVTVAEVTSNGHVTAAKFEQLSNTGNLLYAMELKRSGSGLTTPDIWGISNTLVLGSGISESELVINNGEVQIKKLINVGQGSIFESDSAIIKNLIAENITIE
ncbi:prepilin-type N-terminal cleavage/methylation domain-containing protein [Porticoccaceae bacterium]|nr:prepilin-type N-terminal cleavage/methylation domain-containing protein [Porticoccaceae bacterium]MDB2343049.1 prepilin-type N-terminal cleavage/methylation domain-containing protein [Porticoccaceae bacterium]